MFELVPNALGSHTAIQPAVLKDGVELFRITLMQPNSPRLRPTIEALEFLVEQWNLKEGETDGTKE